MLRISLETASVVVFSSLSTPARLDHVSAMAAISSPELCRSPSLEMDFDQQAGRLQPADLRMRLAGATANVENPARQTEFY